MNTDFSIILPTHNRVRLLPRAIESVLSQKFSTWELIVVDDASSDETETLMKDYAQKDARIHYFRNEVNLERCVTRNRGIECASGQYICFLDSDDYHLPNHLQKLHDFVQEKGEPEAFFFTNAWDEKADGIRTERHCPDFELVDPFTYFLRYTVNPQRWCVHRHIMQKHRFDPHVTICEDMDTSLRVVAAGVPVFQLKERTTVYVAAPDSFTHGAKDKWERELANLEKIFVKAELRNLLPRREKKRLRSMCHYHLAVKAFGEKRSGEVWRQGVQSFLLFPTGYNRRTNKSLSVIILYSLPIFGLIIRWMVKSIKRK